MLRMSTRKVNLEARRAASRRYGERHREVIRARAKAKYEESKANPEAHKLLIFKRNLKKLYGITLEDYQKILDAQNGVCDVCHRPPNGKRLAVDHSHATKKVRALLCMPCNSALGLLGENPETIQKLKDYVLRFA